MNLNFRFALTSLLLACTGAFLHTRQGIESPPSRPNFASFPRSMGNWSGTDQPITREVTDVLGAGDFISRSYDRGPNNPDVDLFIAYFPSQRAGDTIHSPKHCLPGSGWSPLLSRRTTLSLPGQAAFPANLYVIAKGSDRRLVLYWYWAHGRAVASEYWAKFYLVTDSIRLNRSDGSMVRITTPLRPDETADAGQKRLQAFAEQLVPLLHVYVPS